MFFLILECICEGIGLLLIYIIMNKFTFYHALIPFHALFCFINLLEKQTTTTEVIIYVICLILEIIFILIFLEIIELNFCNLNKNLKRNIEERAIKEAIFDENDDEVQIVYVDKEKNYYIKVE